jgi:hypothetical protein
MSYNIDSIHIVKGGLRCDRGTFEGLKAEFEDNLPECCFLHGEFEGDVLEFTEGSTFEFCGSGSGRQEKVLSDILRSLEGSADLVLVWEGGDSFTGLRKTLFGTVEEMEVRFVLE